ncbi:MAG: AMP-binding protein, partial [Oxalobacteraceae bacterium]
MTNLSNLANRTNLTISHDRGPRDSALIEQTIGSFFDAMTDRVPDREALVSCHQNIRYTYRQLQTEARRLSSALLNLGLQRGDRVGIWSHNNAQWLLTQ